MGNPSISKGGGGVSSSSSKQRLRWTPDLHQKFVNAVTQLGGPERATPKGVLKVMSVQDLTIYHIKSHLQKYRLAKYVPDNTPLIDSHQNHFSFTSTTDATSDQPGIHLTDTLRVHVEVQKRLQQQLEVQRQLQQRIEAQGRYLQSIIEEQKKKLTRSSTLLESSTDFEANNMVVKDRLDVESKQDSSTSESIVEVGLLDSRASSPENCEATSDIAFTFM